MKIVYVEIRAAEGGDDAKLLVREQLGIYVRWALKNRLECSVVDDRPGMVVAEVVGEDPWSVFRLEPGGHRWQRVPPTETRGRVHTSTVTVAVLQESTSPPVGFSERDLVWKATRGSGAGGQKRNKTSSAVQMTHIPTGLNVRIETERSQRRNLDTARALLFSRVTALTVAEVVLSQSNLRREQVGSGQRGDKVRTVSMKRNTVVDHQTGRRMPCGPYLLGDLSPLGYGLDG